MMTEVLTKYGPVNRLWFDGVNTDVVQKDMKSEAVYKPYYDSVFKMIREISPETLISAYRFVLRMLWMRNDDNVALCCVQ